jgi:hypothetical protein
MMTEDEDLRCFELHRPVLPWVRLNTECTFIPLKADSHIPCRSPAMTLPFYDSAVSFVKVPYLVYEVLLLSPSRIYLLLIVIIIFVL